MTKTKTPLNMFTVSSPQVHSVTSKKKLVVLVAFLISGKKYTDINPDKLHDNKTW